MTILLSGATGFLGSYLLKRFMQEGFDVIALTRSTSDTYRIKELLSTITYYDVDTTEIKEIFKKHNIDIVVNTVTDYGRSNSRISSILETNLMFSVRLLENAVENNVKTFINTDTLLEKEINAYALSKNQLVQWMQFLSDKINMINIKIEHMYGPLDDDNKFIYWVINQLQQNVEKIDLTNGVQKRDFIYIDDVVEAYMTIIINIEKFSSYEEFELGSGDAIEVKEFLNLVYNEISQKQVLTTKLNFGAVEYRPKENMCMEADISKLLSLGWEPSVKLEEGIKKILNGELSD
ncbi:NAD-dependent epimerase/dehydratase [Sulfurovum sp. XTW-4]|uniref:NAD-dependent epimerase/dehydratase n=1 Tax=Sulfurovum xiamenensis TaxID=3019066 RepID=A0ABT7QRK6_9BACT|nr:NAD-dependent epimerase/dehydratase [Sulfurovum xiamenensis]MDM5263701.1 NAD-dependent epimerase/dehydratase [Sulfurovum xiamenensis]